MKKNIVALAPVIILSLMTGCGKISFDTLSRRAIGVSVSVQDGLLTKGTEITNKDSLKLKYGKFVMDCWVDADYTVYSGTDSTKVTDRHYFDKVDVNYNKNNDTWNFGSAQFWLNGVNMAFWSWAPKDAEGLKIDNSDLAGEVGSLGELDFTYTTPSTVKAQKDLLFAYTYSEAAKHTETSENNALDIMFYHALAQIRFAVSPDDGHGDGSFNISSTDGYEIVSIALNGVPSYGKCTFTGASSSFAWSGLETPVSFTSSCGNYTTAEWKKGNYTSSGHTYDLYTTKEVFFVIPNSVAGKTADITFKRKSDSQLITKQVELKDAGTGDPHEWKAGKYYTYKIKATDIVSDLSLTLSTDPWDSVEEDLSYHTVVAKSGGQLTFEDGKYIPAADPDTREVTIKNGQPIPASFWLEAPEDGEIIITLSGYIDAFKVDNIVNDTINGSMTTFEIVPLIDDPKMDYKVQVHVYVKFKDGKVVNADDVVQADGIPHTVILPAI